MLMLSIYFVYKILLLYTCIQLNSNLVNCYQRDDSLQDALEAIYRRQRNLELQENSYYGQPENIGYGFQKNLGFFENGPAKEIGSRDLERNEEKLQDFLSNYIRDEDKRSNFRERNAPLPNNYLVHENHPPVENGIEYLELLKNLWNKYQKQHSNAELEDLTSDQVEEILNYLNDEDELQVEPGYSSEESYVPLRNRRNYRVFDGIRSKRYPSFGTGLYGKRSSQNIGYETPPENNFLYSLKYVNPDLNREAVEALDDGFQVAEEKDPDVLKILNERNDRPLWLEEPVRYPYYEESNHAPDEESYDYDKRAIKQHFFKQHNGVHLNRKRLPVKRSLKKETKNEKVSKELEGIFGKKKATGDVKKNATKPEVTKHVKKIVRRQEPINKEQINSTPVNSDIANLFQVNKKSVKEKKDVDWSKYFGIDKKWLKNDYEKNSNLLLAPRNKRFWHKRSNVGNEFVYQPFDTRVFNTRKRFANENGNMAESIIRMEDKIGNIEDKIIDDAVKYTGVNTGRTHNQQELMKIKNEVLNHLEAAYSLEKMKNALEEFKQTIQYEKNWSGTEAPTNDISTTTVKQANSEVELENAKKKKLSVKKEGVEETYNKQYNTSDNGEFLNWPVSNHVESETEECPILEKVLHNCLRVEEIHGRYVELLLPLCTLQQVCYICGSEIGFSKPSSCDLIYLTEAQNLCQDDSECLISARESMFALRDMLDEDKPQTTDTCVSNPCVQKFFLNSPAAVIPLEFQH